MRQAVASFIKNVSLAGLSLPDTVTGQWLEVLEENMASVEASVQQSAVEAVPAFFDQYCVAGRDKIVARLVPFRQPIIAQH